MQKIILGLLAFFSRLIIKYHKPYVIGVTGTVGKTTITSHVAHFLIEQYGIKNVGHSHYHYNGEYGLPLTIIGAKSPGKNPFLWIGIFILSIVRLFQKYPKYLVLEYGIDHPGEMNFMLNITRPDIAILTPVESNHLEQFKTLENYRSEKILLVKNAKHAIIHESLRQYIDFDAIFYSLGALSDVDASHANISINGTSAIAHFHGENYSLQLPSIGTFQIENILPLYPISHLLGINLDTVAQYASHGSPEAGRSSILKGIFNSVIIDGSYNGGYLSIRAGIVSMRSFLHSHRVIFFIGDMRELGDESQSIHEKLATEILDIIPHESQVEFYLVGPLMMNFVKPILSKKFTVFTSISSRELGIQIQESISKSCNNPTIVYAKGSQNTIFIEEGLKFLLENKEDFHKLPRQSDAWMSKKDIFFSQIK